jgi:hypothetical protein
LVDEAKLLLVYTLRVVVVLLVVVVVVWVCRLVSVSHSGSNCTSPWSGPFVQTLLGTFPVSMWQRSPKDSLAATGFNPEGNARGTGDEKILEIEWPELSLDYLAIEIHSYDKARDLEMVGAAKWLGGREFQVITQREILPNRDPNIEIPIHLGYNVFIGETLSKCRCQCKDYLLRGRACKHIGASLLCIRRTQKYVTQRDAVQNATSLSAASSEEMLPASSSNADPRSDRNRSKPQPTLRAEALQIATIPEAITSTDGAGIPPGVTCWDALRIKARFVNETAAVRNREGNQSQEEMRAIELKPSFPRQSRSQREKERDQALEEALEEVRSELAALRIDVKQSNAGKKVSLAPPIEEVGLRGALPFEFLLSAEEVHAQCIAEIKAAVKGGTVELLGYSFDRRDIGQEMLQAHRRGCNVRLLLDMRQTLKGPKEQFAVVQELMTQGLPVRLCSGNALSPEYRAAGRGGNFGGLVGISHVKMCCVQCSPASSWNVFLGSANWTTSSRCNHEISVKLTLGCEEAELVKLIGHINDLWLGGVEFTEADARAAQRARSSSPRR